MDLRALQCEPFCASCTSNMIPTFALGGPQQCRQFKRHFWDYWAIKLVKNGNIFKIEEINIVQNCVKNYIYFLWINFFIRQKLKFAFRIDISKQGESMGIASFAVCMLEWLTCHEEQFRLYDKCCGGGEGKKKMPISCLCIYFFFYNCVLFPIRCLVLKWYRVSLDSTVRSQIP